MRFMNEWDIWEARRRFTASTTPNRLALVMVVDNLREWADQHSDGWAHWPKPARAAATAMGHIESGTYLEREAQEDNDITDAQMAAAVRPIKAFLTRQRVSADDRERILRSVTS